MSENTSENTWKCGELNVYFSPPPPGDKHEETIEIALFGQNTFLNDGAS